MNFKHYRVYWVIVVFCVLLTSCMKDDEWVKAHQLQSGMQITKGSLFVINEGNFMYGNATLSFYDTLTRKVENDVFFRVNGLPLGDVAESMNIRGNSGYIVVNNSGKIYRIDMNTGKYTAKINGLISPRYMHFVNEEKAYVSDLYSGKITIVNPLTGTITSTIPCNNHLSTEEMVSVGNHLFVTCWLGGRHVLVIDTDKDKVISEIPTGDQPCGIIRDKYNKVWVLCQSMPGNNAPNNAFLQRIDPDKLLIDKSFEFAKGLKPIKLVRNGSADKLFYILGNNVMQMDVLAGNLPEVPFISLNSKLLYALGVDPVNSDIYVSDALDYQQQGIISRFSMKGKLLDNFKAGIIPGGFCFY